MLDFVNSIKQIQVFWSPRNDHYPIFLLSLLGRLDIPMLLSFITMTSSSQNVKLSIDTSVIET